MVLSFVSQKNALKSISLYQDFIGRQETYLQESKIFCYMVYGEIQEYYIRVNNLRIRGCVNVIKAYS